VDTPDTRDILVTCCEDVARVVPQIPRVRRTRLVADMSATRQTILTCRDGLKDASILAAFSSDTSDTPDFLTTHVSDILVTYMLRGSYEETVPVEFSFKTCSQRSSHLISLQLSNWTTDRVLQFSYLQMRSFSVI